MAHVFDVVGTCRAGKDRNRSVAVDNEGTAGFRLIGRGHRGDLVRRGFVGHLVVLCSGRSSQ